jgi:hypothetical protein
VPFLEPLGASGSKAIAGLQAVGRNILTIFGQFDISAFPAPKPIDRMAAIFDAVGHSAVLQ